MGAFNREIVNSNTFSLHSAMTLSKKFDNTSEDINMNKLRNRSILLSTNHFKKSSTHSEILSIPYIDKMEAQNEDLS